MQDLKCDNWTPLTADELRSMESIGLMPGKVRVDRTILARLLGERDRLRCVLEASIWLIDEMINEDYIETVHLKHESPGELQRAAYILRLMIADCQ